MKTIKQIIVAVALMVGLFSQVGVEAAGNQYLSNKGGFQIRSLRTGALRSKAAVINTQPIRQGQCRSGYVSEGQGSECRRALAGARLDSCRGEQAAQEWWSCELPQEEVSCPDEGEIDFGSTYYRCRYPAARVKRSFACAEGYTLIVGEFCGPQGEYCCYKDGNPCGDGAEFWSSTGSEACCVIWHQGPC